MSETMKKWVLGAVAIVLAVIAVVLGYIKIYKPRTPEYSLEKLQLACQAQDAAGMQRYLDWESIVSNGTDEITQAVQDTYIAAECSKFYIPSQRADDIREHPENEAGRIEKRIAALAEERSSEGKPSFFNMKFAFVKSSGGKGSAVIILRPSETLSASDDFARNFHVALTQQSDGHWKVTAIKNAGEFYHYIAETDRYRTKMAIRDVNKIYKERFARLEKRYPEFPASASGRREYRTLLKQMKVKDPPYYARYYVFTVNAVLDDMDHITEITLTPGIDRYVGVMLSCLREMKWAKEKIEHDEAVVNRLLSSLNDIELAGTEEGSSDDSNFSANDLSRYGHTI
ncbi:MAG: hypothetical protein LKE33_01240 [Acidaminococcus sp.]|jgi:hypothetical protein|nr:hypothetical protein [Acidaminococcus sp.]MCI2099691.1 hypothetical protein [Acidaminococcus sp.]MCI2113905.1 hypothetical protein [Acidaminococcus sp.]MCI2115859.1 hypothetical protein [Acidaminococcus sp.]